MTAEGALHLGSMFLAAFGAATILPFQSEVVFVALQIAGDVALMSLLLVASVGNILGSVVNYALGRGLSGAAKGRLRPASARQMARAETLWTRYGVWTLLLSWAPFGDAFTVIAGVLRTNFWLFCGLVTIAKTGRYLALAWATARLAP